MKYGCGLKKDIFRSLMSFMFGVEKMPYCCAAKSIMNDAGACDALIRQTLAMVLLGLCSLKGSP